MAETRDGREFLLLDTEASSLGPESYPIEYGWVRIAADGRLLSPADGFLVQPAQGWDDWDKVSEGVHGIPRPDLLSDGVPAVEAARRLMAAASGAAILVDAQEDRFWLRRLFTAAVRQGLGTDRVDLDIRSFQATLAQELNPAIGRARGTRAQALVREAWKRIEAADGRAEAIAPTTHRAAADALHMAATWATALGRPFLPPGSGPTAA